jgi:hypothetical protein
MTSKSLIDENNDSVQTGYFEISIESLFSCFEVHPIFAGFIQSADYDNASA